MKTYRGGVLKVIRGIGIFVDFGSILWFKSPTEQQKIVEYWHSQGFAEPELVAYKISDGCIEVTRDLPEFGFLKGSGTLDEQIYNIPF